MSTDGAEDRGQAWQHRAIRDTNHRARQDRRIAPARGPARRISVQRRLGYAQQRPLAARRAPHPVVRLDRDESAAADPARRRGSDDRGIFAAGAAASDAARIGGSRAARVRLVRGGRHAPPRRARGDAGGHRMARLERPVELVHVGRYAMLFALPAATLFLRDAGASARRQRLRRPLRLPRSGMLQRQVVAVVPAAFLVATLRHRTAMASALSCCARLCHSPSSSRGIRVPKLPRPRAGHARKCNRSTHGRYFEALREASDRDEDNYTELGGADRCCKSLSMSVSLPRRGSRGSALAKTRRGRGAGSCSRPRPLPARCSPPAGSRRGARTTDRCGRDRSVHNVRRVAAQACPHRSQPGHRLARWPPWGRRSALPPSHASWSAP